MRSDRPTIARNRECCGSSAELDFPGKNSERRVGEAICKVHE
jgi:hypothetical protein